MFCLRSWLPLLFIPTNASPAFIFLFFVCTYFLNRPCVYCSILLLILFLTSCNWSDRCFFDFGSNWFEPRSPVSHDYTMSNTTIGSLNYQGATETLLGDFNATVLAMAGSTAKGLAHAALDEVRSLERPEWTGLGLEWLRQLLGKREWRIACMDMYIRL
ncbi:hypothetical protein NLU13_4414 [Sarocladium strictum]|uniref:Bladder cancer-related BC10-like protein n=1 Tax=Sarocladium strictum TaxID=5046 RepID=A0AA39GJM4_SARSR|nr:hypothetical protein NLU13_4414 [Sarocladium strictum]